MYETSRTGIAVCSYISHSNLSIFVRLRHKLLLQVGPAAIASGPRDIGSVFKPQCGDPELLLWNCSAVEWQPSPEFREAYGLLSR